MVPASGACGKVSGHKRARPQATPILAAKQTYPYRAANLNSRPAGRASGADDWAPDLGANKGGGGGGGNSNSERVRGISISITISGTSIALCEIIQLSSCPILVARETMLARIASPRLAGRSFFARRCQCIADCVSLPPSSLLGSWNSSSSSGQRADPAPRLLAANSPAGARAKVTPTRPKPANSKRN